MGILSAVVRSSLLLFAWREKPDGTWRDGEESKSRIDRVRAVLDPGRGGGFRKVRQERTDSRLSHFVDTGRHTPGFDGIMTHLTDGST